jgi:hypothetical protein
LDWLNNEELDLSFLGKIKDDHIAIRISEGEIDPNTLETYQYSIKSVKLEDFN